jgi:predicted nucleic-acid-binding Zn-ribbon protein
MFMKNGQCPKCSSHEVFCNTNRKFPALNTITVGMENSGNRYVPLDTYICGTCGYLESYVAKPSDLSYIKEGWALVGENGNGVSKAVPEVPEQHSRAEDLPSRLGEQFRMEVGTALEN